MSVAIVTGAARGIGAATAALLAERGHHVIGVDVLPGGLQVDVTEPDAPARILAACPEPPAVLVNNAFAEERAPLSEGTPEGWGRTFEVSLHAAVRLSRAFVAAATGAGDGADGATDGAAGAGRAIVNVASVHAGFAAPGFAAYAAAKAALVAFTRSAALEWGPLGVRVNAVSPGFVAVERNHHVWGDAGGMADRVRAYPLRRAGTPDEVARAVAYLASAEASYVTGAALPVDGGLSVRLPEVL
ncbi:SDR family NAD(P)-dependent oxidoreductase [Spirillospora sp. NPDC050679]